MLISMVHSIANQSYEFFRRAAVRGQEDCVEMLLNRDGDGASADVKWRDNGGLTAFHAAAAAGQISVLGLLLESLDDENAVQTLVDNEG